MQKKPTMPYCLVLLILVSSLAISATTTMAEAKYKLKFVGISRAVDPWPYWEKWAKTVNKRTQRQSEQVSGRSHLHAAACVVFDQLQDLETAAEGHPGDYARGNPQHHLYIPQAVLAIGLTILALTAFALAAVQLMEWGVMLTQGESAVPIRESLGEPTGPA